LLWPTPALNADPLKTSDGKLFALKPPVVPVPAIANDGSRDARPPAPPMRIDLLLNVYDLSSINAMDFTVEVDIEMIVFWFDHRLIGKVQHEIDWDKMWHPQPFISNGKELNTRPADCVLQCGKKGRCKLTQRIWGLVMSPLCGFLQSIS
jgi:hypothetical protein